MCTRAYVYACPLSTHLQADGRPFGFGTLRVGGPCLDLGQDVGGHPRVLRAGFTLLENVCESLVVVICLFKRGV